MSYEDLVTIKAFLIALESLDQPLPKDLQTELGSIAKTLPESAYELHELAERYEPLNQRYLAALHDFPGEGERLKFAGAQPESTNGNALGAEPAEVETLIKQLRHQVSQTAKRSGGWDVIESLAGTVDAPVDWSIGSIQPEASQVSTVKQTTPVKHSIQELGWTEEQAAEIRNRLAAFEEDWDAPGMEIYDDL
jgi:hypothetical protein